MLGRFLAILQYLSIDIVIGAVILLRFFSDYYGVAPSIYVYVCLSIAVWGIYTIDHLVDASKAPNSLRARYIYHLRHAKILKTFLIVVGILAITCLVLIESEILIFGSGLALLSGIYLIVQSNLAINGFKELYVALIYSSGILLSPFVLSQTFDFHLFIQLFLLAYTNLLLFSWFEKEEDVADGFSSIATKYSRHVMEKIILTCLSLGIALRT